MIQEIDRALERWLRADVPMPRDEVEVTFDQPEDSWDARRSTPMVNLFLYSVNRSSSHQRTGTRIVQRPDGGLARELSVPIIEVRYLITAWAGGPALEHELLGPIVNLLSTVSSLPEEHQSEVLRQVVPRPVVLIAPDADTSITHLWSGLGVPPRAAIQLLVFSPMGAAVPVPVPAPPAAVDIDLERTTPSPVTARRRRVLGTVGSVAPKTTIRDGGRPAEVPRG